MARSKKAAEPPKKQEELVPVKKGEIIAPDEEELEGELSPNLTEEERTRLEELEKIVNDSLNKAAFALKEIHDRKLYRQSYDTFADYCTERLKISRRFANYQINYANVLEDFQKEHDVPVLPTSEAQVRALARFSSEKRKEIWLKSCEQAANKVPSREVVQSVLDSEKQETTPRSTFNEDDCVRLKRSDDETLRRYRDCWGYVTKRSQGDTYSVSLPQTLIETIDARYLLKVDVPGKLKKSRQKIFEQLARIYTSESEFEDFVSHLLGYFAPLEKSKLTPFEQKILNLVEKEVTKKAESKAEDES